MFIKGSVFKLILGGLFILGLSAAAAGVVYISFIKPFAPINLNVTISNVGGNSWDDCEPVIKFLDNSQNEDGFQVYRRNLGASAFALIQILPFSPGKGNQLGYVDLPLPLGTYQYRVGAYNQFGETYSNIAQGTVVSSACAKITTIDPSTLPMNPIIVSLSIINDCNVRISYRDNSTNETGFKIVRSTSNSGLTIVANLGPHAGITATYDDKTKLPPGKYYYFINVFNKNGELDSNSKEIEVTSVCNPTLKFLPTKAALVLPTLQKLSGGSCSWEAVTNVFLRKGPDVGIYGQLLSVEAGQGFPIVGQSEDGQFWAVDTGAGVVGYISTSDKYSRTSGDCSSVPTLKDPPPPVIDATPTRKPGSGNHTNPATPCPVGAVCP